MDWGEHQVHFNVTVETKGYVGFGLTRKGKMSGADIVIGGVLPSGLPYFSDRHAAGHQLPLQDISQDWILEKAWETERYTFLSFSRKFDTCDHDNDLEIHGDLIGIIWAFGEKDDEIEYHYHNRGVFYAYLLDPDLMPRELQSSKDVGLPREQESFGKWNIWRILGDETVPPKETTYMCTVHRTPGSIHKRQHAIGVG